MAAVRMVFSAEVAPWIVVGDILGIVVGALPGLTATMGMALVLPLSYHMSPAAAMGLMLGVYFGAVTGASIPAILFGIPGNPNAIATVYDGKALADRGEAGIALGTAVVASFLGGLGSMLVLFVASAPLAYLALAFGPAEYFSLAASALTVVAATSGASVRRGVLACLVGVALATVGVDSVSGVPRFWFGNVYLLKGLSVIPALIGLFGIAQVLEDLHRTRQAPAQVVMPKLGRLLPGAGWFVRRWRIILESLGVGTLIGALPGAGASVGVVLAYERARQRSPHPEQFGKGALEGVLAPEVANNACIGGGLIPTLALGIPGEAAGVVLIAALLLHGVVPGPLMFEAHRSLVYAIFAAMVLANLTTSLFQIAGVRVFAKTLALPPYALSLVILLLSLVGAYAIDGSVFDAAVALGFGALGWWMRRAGYPVIPLVLGLVLGPILESEFRRAVVLAGGSYATFVTRPLSLVLLMLGAMSLGRGAWGRRLRFRLASGSGA